MRLAKLTASTAALLLSSTALLAQEAQTQTMQSVFIDVGGTAVLVPMDVALEACGLDESTLQTTVQANLDASGIDQTQFMAQMDSAMGMMNQGDAATQDTAAAGTGDASGTMATEGTASADAAAGAAGTDASGGVSDTTQTADANATTDAGNATTDMGNTTDTATADASGAAAGDASGAAAGTASTDTATADASGAAGQDATATGDVQNVESTAADTSGAAAGSASADPFLVLAACQIDATRATELQVDTTRTGSSLGFDAATLGIQTQ